MKNTLLELGTSIINQALMITETGKEMNDFWNQTLNEIGFHCVYTSFAQWQYAFSTEPPQIVILDGSQHPDVALKTCREFCQLHPSIPLVGILTRADLVERGAAWHNAGAQDFLRLDATRVEVETVLDGKLITTRLEKELAALKLQIISSHQYDTVTQFLTRRHFFFGAHRECGRARRYGHALSCIMINIDYLDEYNKTFGQYCTNYLLRSVATIIRRWTRESDIVARFAFNKIVALLPETDISGAVMVRERILEAMTDFQFEWDGKPLPATISLGEAERSHALDSRLPDLESPDPISVREEIAQLLEDADTALKIAQKSSQRPEMFIEYSHAELPTGSS
ncbi:MAG: GGDEF domain-containing protein [Abditibacteriaceae bacterium]